MEHAVERPELGEPDVHRRPRPRWSRSSCRSVTSPVGRSDRSYRRPREQVGDRDRGDARRCCRRARPGPAPARPGNASGVSRPRSCTHRVASVLDLAAGSEPSGPARSSGSSGPTPAPGATAPRLAAYRNSEPAPCGLRRRRTHPDDHGDGRVVDPFGERDGVLVERPRAVELEHDRAPPCARRPRATSRRYEARVRSIDPSTLATTTEGVAPGRPRCPAATHSSALNSRNGATRRIGGPIVPAPIRAILGRPMQAPPKHRPRSDEPASAGRARSTPPRNCAHAG